MKTNIKYASIMLGALLTLVPIAAEATLACPSNCWQVGGRDTSVTAAEVSANVDVPNAVSNNAVSGSTQYWIGGYTTSPLGTVLTQPTLLALSTSPHWRGVFQTADASGNVDYNFTSLYWNHPASINLFDELFPSGNPFSGDNFQQISDNNNVNNVASQVLSGTTYGHTMSSIYGALESYDFTGADFSGIDTTPIHFTTFDYAATYGGSFAAVPLSAYSDASTGHSAPTCITSTAGSGTTTVTANSC